jgi:hypothetical protein
MASPEKPAERSMRGVGDVAQDRAVPGVDEPRFGVLRDAFESDRSGSVGCERWRRGRRGRKREHWAPMERLTRWSRVRREVTHQAGPGG